MTTLLIFGLLLYVAVLLSGQASRTVLSISVLFLVAGFLFGGDVLGLIVVTPGNPFIKQFTELALVSVLFVDGMSFKAQSIRQVWDLPGRALLLGLPLTLLGTALLARYLAGFDWDESLLIGAVLSPTDPVFASAIVQRVEVPSRLRRLLNVESGFNDGLALPAVVIMLSLIGTNNRGLGQTLWELALGLAIGVGVPLLATRIGSGQFEPPSRAYQPLSGVALGIIVLALADVLGGNLFFAAFAAGITTVTLCPGVHDAFERFGHTVTELLKLGVLLIFGALISYEQIIAMNLTGYLFAFLALLAVRPIAIELAMIGTKTTWQERLVAAWFGPKGFASIFYGLLIWKAGVPNSTNMFQLIALVVAISIIAHSSTDVVLARWLRHSLDVSTHGRGVSSTS